MESHRASRGVRRSTTTPTCSGTRTARTRKRRSSRARTIRWDRSGSTSTSRITGCTGLPSRPNRQIGIARMRPAARTGMRCGWRLSSARGLQSSLLSSHDDKTRTPLAVLGPLPVSASSPVSARLRCSSGTYGNFIGLRPEPFGWESRAVAGSGTPPASPPLHPPEPPAATAPNPVGTDGDTTPEPPERVESTIGPSRSRCCATAA